MIATRLVIVTANRLYGEALASAFEGAPALEVVGAVARPAVEEIVRLRPGIVLADGRAVRALCRLPELKVVAIGVPEDTRELLELIQAGIAGYVPETASLEELVDTVLRVADGELPCSPAVVAEMARHLSAHAPGDQAIRRLTQRELEVVGLLDEGLSNKEIAQRLRIDHRTVKNHARSVYAKLAVHSRGEAAAAVRRAGWATRPAGETPRAA